MNNPNDLLRTGGNNPAVTRERSLYSVLTDEYRLYFRGTFSYDSIGAITSDSIITSCLTQDSAGVDLNYIYDINIRYSDVLKYNFADFTTDFEGLQSQIFSGPDLITGSTSDDTLKGYAGSDTIYGGAGNDLINAGAEPVADYLYGEGGNDYLAGGGGPDQLYGGIGNDEIRAGHGKDLISGGAGADILYGGGGTNTFLSEADGSIDQLYVMSDFRGHAFDWGRNHGGVNADVITELDTNDRITILGTSDDSLSFRSVAAGTYNQSQSGIGIFDGDSLEALYIGNNLNASQLDAITSGDPSRFS